MFKKHVLAEAGSRPARPPAYYVLEGVSFVLAASRRGQPLVDARSVLSVREHGNMARTPLVAFFNIPIRLLDLLSGEYLPANLLTFWWDYLVRDQTPVT